MKKTGEEGKKCLISNWVTLISLISLISLKNCLWIAIAVDNNRRLSGRFVSKKFIEDTKPKPVKKKQF